MVPRRKNLPKLFKPHVIAKGIQVHTPSWSKSPLLGNPLFIQGLYNIGEQSIECKASLQDPALHAVTWIEAGKICDQPSVCATPISHQMAPMAAAQTG
jgi:hypothetical protein